LDEQFHAYAPRSGFKPGTTYLANFLTNEISRPRAD
jgi:hypothetical protein